MLYKVEKQWRHKSNVCVVVIGNLGHRCGYVGVNIAHPLYGEDYNSKPEVIQNMKEKFMDSPLGKRGVMDIITMNIEEGVRVGDLFDVHGSLTFSGDGSEDYPIKMQDVWWFGYDCAHAGDAKDLSVVSESIRKIEERYPTGGILRSLDYCISECESLSSQLDQLRDNYGRKEPENLAQTNN